MRVLFSIYLVCTSPQVSAVVNGTNDPGGAARDQVVQVGGGCTGTLIAPRIVATAGHCLPEALRALTSPVPGLPSVDGGDNVLSSQEWYPNFVNPTTGITINIGNNSSRFTTFQALHYRPGGFQDIVLLGLSSSVPSSVAIPATVLTQIPGSIDANEFLRDKKLDSVGWGGTDSCNPAPVQFPAIRQKMEARFFRFPVDGQPNRMQVIGEAGAYISDGDSGGPLFWTSGSGRRHLIGVSQQCVGNSGRSNYFATFANGGVDSAGRRRPNLSMWFSDALQPGLDQWSSIPIQPIFRVRDIAVCSDGSLHSLGVTGELWRNKNFGNSGWEAIASLPDDAMKITCAKNSIYFQTTSKEVWLVQGRSESTRVGHPHSAATLSGTQDATLDFPFMWALNGDKTLWFNENAANDATWRRVGQPSQAKEIAAISGSQLFAINNNNTFWINQNNGLDENWRRLPNAPTATIDIAATLDGQSDRVAVFALTSNHKIFRNEYVEGGGQIPDAVQLGDTHEFREPRYAGKRLDWCFRFGNSCDGNTAATAYCKLKGYSRASGFRIENDIGDSSPTYVLGAARICAERTCDGFASVTCQS